VKQIQNNPKDMQTGWDAREGYTKELCWRMHLVLDANQTKIKDWFETLSDFYDCASCALDTDFTDELKHIEELIYSKQNNKGNKGFYTDQQRKRFREEAYNLMRVVFRKIQKELWVKGLYVPLYEKEDLNKSILNVR